MRSSGMSSLTDRELDVLRGMAEGLSNDGVAKQLFISVKSVESTCRSVFRKLGLDRDGPGENRRVKAVVRYLLEGPPQATQAPSPATAFVGRTAELDELEGLLGAARILTLTGPGGIGKTRLALELGRRWSEHGRPVRFMDLTGVVDEAGLVSTAALALGNPNLTVATAGRRIARSFGGEHGLVIFDNADLVTRPAARWVEELSKTDQMTVLVTSRSALRARGEIARPATPMNVADSVALLRGRSGLSMLQAEEEALCNSVGGLPLAIELVAARLATLPLSELLDRPHDLVRLLTEMPGSGRQHLGTVLDAALADVGERAAIAAQRLSVLPGGFDLDAARAVLGDLEVAIVVPQLVDAALVAFDGRGRYRMLESVRQRAGHRLRQGGDQHQAGHHHEAQEGLVAWCLEMVRSVRTPGTDARGGLSRAAAARLDGERANVEAAVHTALALNDVEAALEVVDRLGLHWAMTSARGWRPVGYEVLAAIRGDEHELLISGALLAAGMVCVRAHDPRCIEHLRSARDRFRAAGHEHDAIFTEYWLLRGSFGLIGSFDESIGRAKRLGDKRLVGYLLEAKARHAYLDGRPIGEVMPWLLEAEQLARAAEDPELVGVVLINIANRRLDLDHLARGGMARAEVELLALEAAEIAARASTQYELCEVLLLDYRIEQRYGALSATWSAALGALEAVVARECVVAASVAVLYAAEMVNLLGAQVTDAQHRAVREMQRVAASYANDRPDHRSRLLADNFPALATIEDPDVDDEAVHLAASAMIDLLIELGPVTADQPS